MCASRAWRLARYKFFNAIILLKQKWKLHQKKQLARQSAMLRLRARGLEISAPCYAPDFRVPRRPTRWRASAPAPARLATVGAARRAALLSARLRPETALDAAISINARRKSWTMRPASAAGSFTPPVMAVSSTSLAGHLTCARRAGSANIVVRRAGAIQKLHH